MKKDKSPSYSEMQAKINSWNPVARDGWAIKFSIYAESNVLLIFISMYTGQTIIRYFVDEDDAVEYINYVVSHDATDIVY